MSMNQHNTQSLVEQFLAKGNEIKKVPFRAPDPQGKHLREHRKPVNEAGHVDLHEEAKANARAHDERKALEQEYQILKMRGTIAKEMTFRQWREGNGSS